MPIKDKELRRLKWNEWYSKNREKYNASSYKSRKARKSTVIKWLRELKKTLQCIRCGFNNPAALQFHHRDPEKKKTSISQAVHDRWTRERIEQEMKECDVLCANCHSIEHLGDLFGE